MKAANGYDIQVFTKLCAIIMSPYKTYLHLPRVAGLAVMWPNYRNLAIQFLGWLFVFFASFMVV